MEEKVKRNNVKGQGEMTEKVLVVADRNEIQKYKKRRDHKEWRRDKRENENEERGEQLEVGRIDATEC